MPEHPGRSQTESIRKELRDITLGVPVGTDTGAESIRKELRDELLNSDEEEINTESIRKELRALLVQFLKALVLTRIHKEGIAR